ncbi:MAG TPA: transposase, partial [Bryobacteraceae bacterium]|nr:transposase [Bryobacteraceae bacterium]
MDESKPELVDELLKGYEKPEDVIGENGLLKRLTKALLERALNAELTHHLGDEKHDPAGHNSGNFRNGVSRKTVKGEFGEIVVDTPRDRNGNGNRTDVSTMETILHMVERKYGKARRIWVFDRGIVSEENLAAIRKPDGQYLTGTPRSQMKQ